MRARDLLPWGILAADGCLLLVVTPTFLGSIVDAILGTFALFTVALARGWACFRLDRDRWVGLASLVLALSIPASAALFGPRLACIAGADYDGRLPVPRVSFEPDAARINATRCEIPISALPWTWSGSELLFQAIPVIAPAMTLLLGGRRRVGNRLTVLENG